MDCGSMRGATPLWVEVAQGGEPSALYWQEKRRRASLATAVQSDFVTGPARKQGLSRVEALSGAGESSAPLRFHDGADSPGLPCANTVVGPFITSGTMARTLDRSNCGIARFRGKGAGQNSSMQTRGRSAGAVETPKASLISPTAACAPSTPAPAPSPSLTRITPMPAASKP